jgi:hypothetical protein
MKNFKVKKFWILFGWKGLFWRLTKLVELKSAIRQARSRK